MFIYFVGIHVHLSIGLTVMNVYNWALDFIREVIFELFSKNVINENYLDKFKKNSLPKSVLRLEFASVYIDLFLFLLKSRHLPYTYSCYLHL